MFKYNYSENAGDLYVNENFVCKIPNEVNINEEISFDNITYRILKKIYPIKSLGSSYNCHNIIFMGEISYKYISVDLRNKIKNKHKIDILNYVPDYTWDKFRNLIIKYIKERNRNEFKESKFYEQLKYRIEDWLQTSSMVADDIIYELSVVKH